MSTSHDELDGELELNDPYHLDPVIHQILQGMAHHWANEKGQIRLSQVGERLKRIMPTFDPKSYGFDNLSQLVQHLGFKTAEVEQPDAPKNSKIVYVCID